MKVVDLDYGIEGRRPDGQMDAVSRGLAAFASVMAFGREASASWEAAALVRDPVFAGRGIPHGNGQKVLLVPGLMAGDASLGLMHDWLHRIGYETLSSHIGFNVGCPSATMRRLAVDVSKGGEKVAVIGHSKGGLVALMLAQTHPELVSQVVTMGSPLINPFDVKVLTRAAMTGIGAWRRAHREQGCCDHCYTPQCTCQGVVEMRGIESEIEPSGKCSEDRPVIEIKRYASSLLYRCVSDGPSVSKPVQLCIFQKDRR